MSYSIDVVLELLSSRNSDELQTIGLEEAHKIKCLSVLIMPVEDKSIWENCARVLATKSDDELERYYSQLLEWLQDLTWPGAYIIYDRLLLICNDHFHFCLKNTISIAKMLNDFVWYQGLCDFVRQYDELHKSGLGSLIE